MAIEYPNCLNALASVTASAHGAQVTPTFNGASPGFAPTGTGSAHTATGVYDLALDTPLSATQGTYLATARSATAGANASASYVSDGVVRVTTDISGTASDAVSFDIAVYQR